MTGEWNNGRRHQVTVNGITSGVTMLRAAGKTAIIRTGVLGMLAGATASVPLVPSLRHLIVGVAIGTDALLNGVLRGKFAQFGSDGVEERGQRHPLAQDRIL